MPFDISTMSDAELGAIVRARMIAQQEAGLIDRVNKLRPVQEKAEAKSKKKHDKARKKLRNMEPLEPIVVTRDLTIPELDVRDVKSLHDLVSAVERAPYSMAAGLFDLGPVPEEVTYADLLLIHQIVGTEAVMGRHKLPAALQDLSEPEPEKDETKDRITAIMASFEVSKKKARKILAEYEKAEGRA